jgi:hypothetical protein
LYLQSLVPTNPPVRPRGGYGLYVYTIRKAILIHV